MPATKQQIRQIIADNNLNSVADVYSLLRESFKDLRFLNTCPLSACRHHFFPQQRIN